MAVQRSTDEHRRLITGRCLIATDIDQTLLFRGAERERQHFLETVAPELLRAASLGTNLAFLTANSLHEVGSRFLTWLVDQLCHTDRIEVLDRFHFFCNSAGVYFRFPVERGALKQLSSARSSTPNSVRILRTLFSQDEGRGLVVRPHFIDAGYVERSRIPDEDAKVIARILEAAGRDYFRDLTARIGYGRSIYDLSQV